MSDAGQGRRRLISLLVSITLMAGISACERHISDRDIVLVTAGDAVEIIEGKSIFGNKRAAWVDARSPREFAAGHVPDAINMPFQNVEREHTRLKRYDVLVVYGNDFHDPKAAAMSKRLLELGHKDVRTLRGGLRGWLDAGYATETGK